MILIESGRLGSSPNPLSDIEKKQSTPSTQIDSNSVINTANALLAISAAFSSQSNQNGQSQQIPAILKLQNAIVDNMKTQNQLQQSSSTSSSTVSTSTSSPQSNSSSDSHMDDLIYKNSPLRHYHNHYKSSIATTQNLTNTNQSKQNEQNQSCSAQSSPTSTRSIPTIFNTDHHIYNYNNHNRSTHQANKKRRPQSVTSEEDDDDYEEEELVIDLKDSEVTDNETKQKLDEDENYEDFDTEEETIEKKQKYSISLTNNLNNTSSNKRRSVYKYESSEAIEEAVTPLRNETNE